MNEPQTYVQDRYDINPPAAEEPKTYSVVATKKYTGIGMLIGSVEDENALPMTSFSDKSEAEQVAKSARGQLVNMAGMCASCRKINTNVIQAYGNSGRHFRLTVL